MLRWSKFWPRIHLGLLNRKGSSNFLESCTIELFILHLRPIICLCFTFFVMRKDNLLTYNVTSRARPTVVCMLNLWFIPYSQLFSCFHNHVNQTSFKSPVVSFWAYRGWLGLAFCGDDNILHAFVGLDDMFVWSQFAIFTLVVHHKDDSSFLFSLWTIKAPKW